MLSCKRITGCTPSFSDTIERTERLINKYSKFYKRIFESNKILLLFK